MRKRCIRMMCLAGATVILSVGLWQLSTFALIEHPPGNRRQIPQRPGAVVEQPQPPAHAPGQLIVKLKEGHDLAALQALNAQYGVITSEPVFKTIPDPRATLKTLKERLARVSPGHTGWHWATTDASEAKEYQTRLAAERAALARQVEAQEQLIARLERRQQRAPKDNALPVLDTIHLLKTAETTDIPTMAAVYQVHPAVVYAQPNYRVRTQGFPDTLPNDTYVDPEQDGTWAIGAWGQPYEDLWGLKKIQADQAWKISQGEGIIVAVVDTGVDYTHPDLAANIWINTREIPFNGIDDDGNGFVDDVRGWDFVDRSATSPVADNDPMDGHGHGTHMAGIIAATGNNALGTIGVALQAIVMPVKSLDNTGAGFDTEVARGITYAALNGADIISCSWGALYSFDDNPLTKDAIRVAHGLGTVVVLAAGNDGRNVVAVAPQNMTDPKPIVVAATTPDDTLAPFTNTGFLVDVAAPGGGSTTPPPNYAPAANILSLKASACDARGCDPKLIVGAAYFRRAGTSMAAAYVSGVAALVLAHRPTLTNDEVRQILRASADGIRLNAARALTVLSVPTVKLTNPRSQTVADPTTQQTVTVTGTAAGAGFQQYELSYGEGLAPTAWIPIGNPRMAPVVNGTLGMWEISTLHTGYYTLRLVVTTAQGLQFSDLVGIGVDQSPVPLSPSPHDQYNPAISGSRVVWADQPRGGDSEIYLYDLATNVERPITTDPSAQVRPAISGDRIVWEDQRNGPNAIYLYDLVANAERRITDDLATQLFPAIAGDFVVWQDDRNGNWDIYLYNSATNTTRRITHDADAFYPAISGNHIVWMQPSLVDGQRESPYDIYLYDLATNTERQITTDPANQLFPAIVGDRIVWQDDRNGNWDIYLYDLTTNIERRITMDTADQSHPKISGNRIVWQDNRYGNSRYGDPDIFYYDLTTGAEHPLVIHRADQGWRAPDIFGRRVVWSGSNNGPINIYTKQIPNHPPVFQLIGDRVAKEGQLLSFTVTATDLDGDALQFSASGLPPGATFDPAMATFTWTPSATQVGHYQVAFEITDGELTASETITITVQEAILALGGRITLASGAPVPNVTVRLLRGDRLVGTARTSADGRYQFEGVASKRYEVQPRPTNRMRFVPTSRDVRMSHRDRLDLNFRGTPR